MKGNTDQFRIYAETYGWLQIIVWHYTGGPQPGSFCLTMNPGHFGATLAAGPFAHPAVLALRLQDGDTMLFRVVLRFLRTEEKNRNLFWYTFEVESRNQVSIPTDKITDEAMSEELI
jgi:hypothetical protein